MSSHQPSFYERHFLWILLAFAVGLPFVVHGKILSRSTNSNDVRQWLPADFNATRVYEYFEQHFGTDEYAIVSWAGCTMEDPRLDTFVQLLRDYRDKDGQSLFQRVTTGPMLLEKLTSAPFSIKREEAVERLQGLVIGRDGTSTCAIVVLTDIGDASRRHTVDEIRRLLVEKLGLEAADIHMAGDAVTSAEVDIASEQAIESLVLWSILIAVVCAYLSLKSLPLVLIVFTVAIYSSLFPEALLYWLGGSVNLVLVVMPVLVYVLTISAGVHLMNYYKDAVAGHGMIRAPLRMVLHGWVPCTMAAGTTAIGLGSLYVSHIRPVKDFGFYSALGLFSSLAFVFLLLPALLVANQRFNPAIRGQQHGTALASLGEDHLFDRIVDALGNFVLRHSIALGVLCLATLLLVGWGAFSINTSVRPRRFFDEDSRLIRAYDWLSAEHRFGPQVPIELVIKFDREDDNYETLLQMQLVHDLQQDLRASKSELIGSTMSAVTFAPPLDPSHYERFTMNKRLTENLPSYRDVHYYSSETNGSNNSVDLWRISARVARVEMDYDEVIRRIADHVEQFLVDRRQTRATLSEDLAMRYQEAVRKAKAKLAELREQHADNPEQLAKDQQDFDEEFYRVEKKFKERQAALVDDTQGVKVIYTGMVPLFHEAQNELLTSLFESFLLAFVLIAALMIVWFRSIRAGMITMLPNIFPAAIIFGGMGWTGTIVDIGSMMTASVAMGIAVDDTVHYLTWFRRGLEDGMTNRQAMLYAYHRCALAMTQTTLIAGLGILIFWLSSFQPVSQFGLLMFVLLVAALVGDLVFLPALLAGRAGRLFAPVAHRESRQPAEQVVV